MFRFLTRVIAVIVLAAGFAAFVVDGTRSIAGGELAITPAAELIKGRLPALEQSVSRNIHPLLWDPLLVGLLRLPAWLVLALVGLALLRLAARPRRVIGRTVRS